MGTVLAVCVPALAVAAIELPHVFKAGDRVSANEMNENFEALRAKVVELEERLDAEKSHVAYDSISPFEISDTGFTAIAYKTKRTDSLGEYVGGKFGPKEAGDYLVCASLVPSASNLALDFELDVFVNDVRGSAIGNSAGTLNVAAGCTVLRLADGDKIDVRAHSSSAAVPVTTSNDNFDWLTITRVH
ncbi:MAG: hypothetical protein ABUL60_20475 [Myxococcales bacterium]